MLDVLFEIIVELIFEGTIEISKNRKVSKWIRYPLIALIVLFFGLIVFLILYLGFAFLKENVLLGFLLIAIAIILLVGCIIKFKNVYIEKIEK